jgi:DNA-binding HxlR family transcriptional regulator
MERGYRPRGPARSVQILYRQVRVTGTLVGCPSRRTTGCTARSHGDSKCWAIGQYSFGDQRFTDLRTSLVGIPPNVLSQRLKDLTAEGMVATRELPPPAARTVYTLTDYGRSTAPVLRALSRFGLQRLGTAGPDTDVRPEQAVFSAVTGFYDATAAEGVDERYRLEVDGRTFTLASTRGGPDPDERRAPDLTVTAPAWALVDLRLGTIDFDDALRDGVIATSGPTRALRHFRQIFQLT